MLVLLLTIYLFNWDHLYAREERIEWKPVKNADMYFIEISKDKRFNNIIVAEKIKKPEYVWSNVSPGIYYFRIASLDGSNRQGSFSNISKILIYPSEPVIMNKTNYIITKSNQKVNIIWNKSNGVEYFIIEVSLNNDFKKIEKTYTSKNNFYNIGLNGSKRLFLRVINVHKSGLRSKPGKVIKIELSGNNKENKEQYVNGFKKINIGVGLGLYSYSYSQSTNLSGYNLRNVSGSKSNFGSISFMLSYWPWNTDFFPGIMTGFDYLTTNMNISNIDNNSVSSSDLSIFQYLLMPLARFRINNVLYFIAGLGFKVLPKVYVLYNGIDNIYYQNKLYALYVSEKIELNYIRKNILLGLAVNFNQKLSVFPYEAMIYPEFNLKYNFSHLWIGLDVSLFQKNDYNLDLYSSVNEQSLATSHIVNKLHTLKIIIGYSF